MDNSGTARRFVRGYVDYMLTPAFVSALAALCLFATP